MKYKNILITGGAGFVGSNLALKLKGKYPESEIAALDNLKRRGSELNLPRLKSAGINFFHGDIRNKEDFEQIEKVDLILECSAEPSVLAGIYSSPEYVINTNLSGTINCLEFSRVRKADFLFFSTSRVYPVNPVNNLEYIEEENRFNLAERQNTPGVSKVGISENFPLEGARSFYGTTKLASELLIQEYTYAYGLNAIVNRCSVITGPWQMGKVDQGVFVLWIARHIFGGKLSYIGYGGEGKQVRDFIHIDDIFDILDIQLNDFEKFSGKTHNIGGGLENSVSLKELTMLCEKVTGKKIKIESISEDRPADMKLYVTDNSKIEKITGWKPKRNIEQITKDVAKWIEENKEQLRPILS
jgi:CDP-paratose 2-epimerase